MIRFVLGWRDSFCFGRVGVGYNFILSGGVLSSSHSNKNAHIICHIISLSLGNGSILTQSLADIWYGIASIKGGRTSTRSHGRPRRDCIKS